MSIKDYSTTASSNTALFPEGMNPGSVNNSARQVQADIREFYETPQWRDLGHTVTYASTTTFTISGDKTSQYVATQRIRCYGTIMGTLYGSIVSSGYSSPNTTVTVTLDSGSLTSNLSAVALGVDPSNDPIPASAIKGISITNTELDKTAVTGQSSVTAATDDYVLGSDTSDTGNLKKFTVQSVADKAGLSGSIAITGTSTEAAYITLAEDTDNGTNKVKVQAPASISSDYTVTLPASAGTVALTSDIITLGTYTALSGGSVDFTGIPSTAKRITINFVGMSTNGSDSPRIQIGDSGGIESSGYVGQSNYTSTGGVVTSFSSGFDMPNWSGTLIGSGSVTLTLADSATNTWCLSGNVGITGSGAAVVVMGGYKSLSATLDRVRITTSGGNTFDAGSVNVMYS